MVLASNGPKSLKTVPSTTLKTRVLPSILVTVRGCRNDWWIDSVERVHIHGLARNTRRWISLGGNISGEGVIDTKVNSLGFVNLGELADRKKKHTVDLVDQVNCRITAGALDFSDMHAGNSDVLKMVRVGDLNITVGGSRKDGSAINSIGILTYNGDLFRA